MTAPQPRRRRPAPPIPEAEAPPRGPSPGKTRPPPGPGANPPRSTVASLLPQGPYARSVFSMMNLTFSSVSSVIRTVGWLAYGIVPHGPPTPGVQLRCATAAAAAGSGSARPAPLPQTRGHSATCRPEAAAARGPVLHPQLLEVHRVQPSGEAGTGKTRARPRLNDNTCRNSYCENGCSCKQSYTFGGVPCSTVCNSKR